jgi:hypothetical protein
VFELFGAIYCDWGKMAIALLEEGVKEIHKEV